MEKNMNNIASAIGLLDITMRKACDSESKVQVYELELSDDMVDRIKKICKDVNRLNEDISFIVEAKRKLEYTRITKD